MSKLTGKSESQLKHEMLVKLGFKKPPELPSAQADPVQETKSIATSPLQFGAQRNGTASLQKSIDAQARNGDRLDSKYLSKSPESPSEKASKEFKRASLTELDAKARKSRKKTFQEFMSASQQQDGVNSQKSSKKPDEVKILAESLSQMQLSKQEASKKLSAEKPLVVNDIEDKENVPPESQKQTTEIC